MNGDKQVNEKERKTSMYDTAITEKLKIGK